MSAPHAAEERLAEIQNQSSKVEQVPAIATGRLELLKLAKPHVAGTCCIVRASVCGKEEKKVSARIVEKVREELMSVSQPLASPFVTRARAVAAYVGGQTGIEYQRERHGEVAVELALALADQLWCSTCRSSVENGVQVRNHRRMGHVVELT